MRRSPQKFTTYGSRTSEIEDTLILRETDILKRCTWKDAAVQPKPLKIRTSQSLAGHLPVPAR